MFSKGNLSLDMFKIIFVPGFRVSNFCSFTKIFLLKMKIEIQSIIFLLSFSIFREK